MLSRTSKVGASLMLHLPSINTLFLSVHDFFNSSTWKAVTCSVKSTPGSLASRYVTPTCQWPCHAVELAQPSARQATNNPIRCLDQVSVNPICTHMAIFFFRLVGCDRSRSVASVRYLRAVAGRGISCFVNLLRISSSVSFFPHLNDVAAVLCSSATGAALDTSVDGKPHTSCPTEHRGRGVEPIQITITNAPDNVRGYDSPSVGTSRSIFCPDRAVWQWESEMFGLVFCGVQNMFTRCIARDEALDLSSCDEECHSDPANPVW